MENNNRTVFLHRKILRIEYLLIVEIVIDWLNQFPKCIAERKEKVSQNKFRCSNSYFFPLFRFSLKEKFRWCSPQERRNFRKSNFLVPIFFFNSLIVQTLDFFIHRIKKCLCNLTIEGIISFYYENRLNY